MSSSSAPVDVVAAVLDRLIECRVVTASLDGSEHDLFPVAIDADEVKAVRAWVHRERPVRSIETGFGYGLSALAICHGFLLADRMPQHVAIDPYQRSRFSDLGLQHVAEAGLSTQVTHLARRSELVLPALLEAGDRFDFALVDGNHRFDGVFLDLFYLGRLLEPGSVIFIDDYQLPGVVKAVSFFVANLQWQIEEVSSADPTHGWAVVRTSAQPDTRAFDDFADF